MSKSSDGQDVVIIGAGIAGGALCAILARTGVRVLLLDTGPRAAIGESVIPFTSMMLRLLAKRHDVPELALLSTGARVQSTVSPGSGLKQGFGFRYHRAGRDQDPAEANENVTPPMAGEECHLVSDEVDAWCRGVAAGYGADVVADVSVTDVHFDDDGATVHAADGRSWRTRFVVDTSADSVLARQFGLREAPTRLRHHSRALGTHMAGVALPADLTNPNGDRRHRYRATLHHVFDGGYLWVSPLRNDERVAAPLAAVGLCVDPRVHPDHGLGPDAEFRRFVARFPGIGDQFAGASAVRDWTVTGRQQYSSTRTVGHRWCVTSQAAGFVDPLFCLGLANDVVLVGAIAPRLLTALRENDFAVERFEFVERLERGMLDFADDLVANTYTSTRSYESWNAWLRMWILQTRLSLFGLHRAYGIFRTKGDPARADELTRLAAHGSIPDHPRLRELFDLASKQMRAVAEHRIEPRGAAAYLFELFTAAEQSHLLPVQMGFANPDFRGGLANSPKRAGLMRWAKRDAPPEVGAVFRDGLRNAIRTSLAPSERVARRLRAARRPR